MLKNITTNQVRLYGTGKQQDLSPTTQNLQPQYKNSKTDRNEHLVKKQPNPQSYLPPPSKVIKNYHIDFGRTIGAGNFSSVHPTFDSYMPNSPLLVTKLIDMNKMRNDKLTHLVTNETQILQTLYHDNVISCRDTIINDYWCYIIMDYCDGGTLQAYIKAHHNLVPENNQSLRYICEVLEGMVYLESKNIIHRDIKAANIFIKQNRAIVADFGFARYLGGQHIVHDLNLGSLPYMAPQALSKSLYNQKTDVWSFGVLVYELFHGESPYAKSHNIQQLKEKVHTPLSVSSKLFRHDLSPALKQLIVDCLTIDYEARPTFAQLKSTWFYKQLFEKRNGNGNANIYGSPRISNTNKYENYPRPFTPRQQPQFQITSPRNKEINYDSPHAIKNQSRTSGEHNLIWTPQNFVPNDKILLSPTKYNVSNQKKEIMNNISSDGIVHTLNYSKSDHEERREHNSAEPINKFGIGITVKAKSRLQKIANQKQKNQGKQIMGQIATLDISNSANNKNNKQFIIEMQSCQNKQIPMISQKSSGSESEKYTFREVLLQIQQSRDYYKLGINLKVKAVNSKKTINYHIEPEKLQNQKISLIRDRMIIRAFEKICYVEKLVENQCILYGVEPSDQRKNKIQSVIQHYKVEFEKQIKKRDLAQKLEKGQFIKKPKTPAFLKLTCTQSHKNLERDNVTRTNQLLQEDLQEISRILLRNAYQNSLADQAYAKKIKEFIDDLHDLKKSQKHHREL